MRTRRCFFEGTFGTLALLSACGASEPEPSEWPGWHRADACFVAAPMYCRMGPFGAPAVRPFEDDRDLGLCLHYLERQITSRSQQADFEATFHYDEQGRLVDIATECGQGETIHTRAEIDVSGRIVRWMQDVDRVEDDVTVSLFAPAMVRTLRYDGDGRLVGDEIDNGRTEIPGAVISWSHDLDYEDGKLVAMDERGLYYPVDYDGTLGSHDESTTYRYRADGRLEASQRISWVFVDQPYTTTDTTFGYAFDKLVLRSSRYVGAQVDGAAATYYQWDGDELVHETYASTTEYSYADPWMSWEERRWAHDGRTVTITRSHLAEDVGREIWELDEEGRPVRLEYTAYEYW